MRVIAFYKPFGVVCQFSGEGRTLSDFKLPSGVYAAGRLDKDSEGLLILTDNGSLNQKLTHPNFEKQKTYHVQVENIPSEEDLNRFRKGLKIKEYISRPAQVRILENTDYPPRDPPIRERKNIPTCWLEVKLTEGKNRQVRKMTAAIGHPTLRLIRVQVAKITLKNLKPGEWMDISNKSII